MFLELFGISGVAIAIPIFQLLTNNPDLLILWRTSVAENLWFVVIALFFIPAAAWVIEISLGLISSRLRRLTHAVFLGIGVAIVAVASLKSLTSLGPTPIIVLGVFAGAILTLSRLRWNSVAAWFTFLAIAPAAMALLFVFHSPASSIIFNSDPDVSEHAAKAPKRVVFVMLDELPLKTLLDGRGNIDRELFPNIAALGDDSTLYRNTTTVSPSTTSAVPAALTGVLPEDKNAIADVSKHPRNLFTLLGAQYRLNVEEDVTHLCPTSLCAPAPPKEGGNIGLSAMLRSSSKAFITNNSPWRAKANLASLEGLDLDALKTFDDFILNIEPSKSPTLDFLHVQIPHFPWHYLGSGQDYTSLRTHPNGLEDIGTGAIGALQWVNDASALIGQQRHVMNTMAADLAVGRLVARLREIKAYDDTLIILTADHGVSFEAKEPFRGVSATQWSDIAWVPLFIKAPGQVQGKIDDRPAQVIDILPTIADHLKIDIPWSLDGESLLGSVRKDDKVRILDWRGNTVKPSEGNYNFFDRSIGFEKVLRSRVTPSGTPAWRRPYTFGEFGHLVGEQALPLMRNTDHPRTGSLTLPDLYFFENDRSAHDAPWAEAVGTFDGPEGTTLAITSNGIIVSVVVTQPIAGPASGWWGLIPPQYLLPEQNGMGFFEVSGTSSEPSLTAITPVWEKSK